VVSARDVVVVVVVVFVIMFDTSVVLDWAGC
jgi:hypothetical protein